LFSPETVPELHELHGLAFEAAYEKREQEFEAGQLVGKRLEAKALWRKMLTMLFETGHPWITFKDPCNVRSPQDHAGVIHSSNLCTEITLNTSTQETAVCNLGSVNLAQHVKENGIDYEKLEATIQVAVRMLDNVIDINYYPTPEAERANMQHRAVGLGVMGYQELLYEMGLPFPSDAHIALADQLFERLSYFAIQASARLAGERGAYPSFQGSKWSKGIFPLDTIHLLEQERGVSIECNRTSTLDWDSLKKTVQTGGLRNSNIMAIAPTATIANIVGTTPCIEPTFKNLFVNSNLSGEFTLINQWLIRDLEKHGLWTEEMSDALKASDGKLSRLQGIPADLVAKYPDIFEIDQTWLIKAAAVRGKWLDQSQSLNLFVAQPSGKHLHELYMSAWKAGLKTTYYLRTLAASQIEKATVNQNQYGKTHTREAMPLSEKAPQLCAIEDPECEACQ
jgi:ribonucleoside-diphosphate reductase alpha chain